MSVSNYTRIFILSIIFSISWAVELPCNYVGDATMIDQNTGSEDHNDNPVPVGVCRTKYNNTINTYESEMFVCSPWGPYYFKFMTANCAGSTPNVSDVISGDYNCDGQSSSCSVFKVKTAPPANANGCALGVDGYHEFVTLTDTCWVSANRDCHDGQNGDICNVTYKSAYATCNPITEQINYDEYKGIACDGNATHSIDAVSKECADVPNGDGPAEKMYIELSECGEIPATNTDPCSKVVGGHYIEERNHGDHSDYKNQTITAPMGFDTCTNEYRDGKYQSEMVWCSETLGRGFIGQWFNRTGPTRCNTPPDRVYQIEDPTIFQCNEAVGGCPSMMIRTSDFEDKDGNLGCAFGNEWNEMRILTDECFYMDGDTGSVGRSVCTLDGGTGGVANFNLTIYADMGNCQAETNEQQGMNFDNNECYSFDGDTFGTKYENTAGNWSFFQALDCEGTLINNNDIRPDCNFVRNARWYEPSQNENDTQNDRGGDSLTLPIGMCQSRQVEDIESESESKMFICTPWDTVVVAIWDDIGCNEGDGKLMYITDVMSNDYQCGKSSNCPIIKVEINPIMDNDMINNCENNATSWDEKIMIQTCTDGLVDGPGDTKKFGSTMVSCDNTAKTLTYSIYGAPGCVGTATTINAADGTCAQFGNDPTYVDLVECGTLPVDYGSECSYVVNPIYNRTEDNEPNVRDGVFPLSTEICTTSYENGRSMSEMYFCDYASQLAFYARYNNSRGCKGEPSEIDRIWSNNDMVCSGNEASRCSYVLVSSSESKGDICQPSDRIEQSARIIEKCWPGTDDECTGNDCYGSWMVDCDGDDVEVYLYGTTDIDCSDDPVKHVDIRENGCSEFDDNDGQMWFQVHACTEGRDPTGVPTTQPTADDYCETVDRRQWTPGSIDSTCYLCHCQAEGNNGLKNACDQIIDNIPEEWKTWIMDECGYVGCDFNELRKKDDFSCDCDGFECEPNASKGNMFKMFVSVVLGMFMWIIN